MNKDVRALTEALDLLRNRLMSTPRTDEGFGEMRALYRDLTRALVDAGDKADSELADEIRIVGKAVVDEWVSNRDKLQPWIDVLSPVVSAVGAIMKAGSLSNPLSALLP